MIIETTKLAQEIAFSCKISQTTIRKILRIMTRMILDELLAGNNVRLRGLGTFYVRSREIPAQEDPTGLEDLLKIKFTKDARTIHEVEFRPGQTTGLKPANKWINTNKREEEREWKGLRKWRLTRPW